MSRFSFKMTVTFVDHLEAAAFADRRLDFFASSGRT
jgi:hypothetical protein